MKQTLRFFVIFAMTVFSMNAFADTTIVGAEDNTAGFWSVFSPYYTIKPGESQHLEYMNCSSKTENFDNWVVAVTNDADRGATGYSEYVVLRCDNWGWNSSANTSNNTWYTSLESNYNWTTFKTDMDSSSVAMDVSRNGAVVTIYADITTLAGTKYFEKFVINCGDGTQNIRMFLTTEKGHLVIDNSKTSIAVTGIRDVTDKTYVNNGKVFSINGQQINASKLQRGIYIQNGKKFSIR